MVFLLVVLIIIFIGFCFLENFVRKETIALKEEMEKNTRVTEELISVMVKQPNKDVD